MSDDILARLDRHPLDEWEAGLADDIRDAAAEIARLRAENERLRGDMRLLLAERLRPPTEDELASVRD